MSVYSKRTVALKASHVKAGWILIGCCHFYRSSGCKKSFVKSDSNDIVSVIIIIVVDSAILLFRFLELYLHSYRYINRPWRERALFMKHEQN